MFSFIDMYGRSPNGDLYVMNIENNPTCAAWT